MVSCVVFGCTSRSNPATKGVTFHRFPKNEELRKLWIAAVRRENWTPTPSSALCSLHFLPEDLDRSSLVCVRVRDSAIPTVFPALSSYRQKKARGRKTPGQWESVQTPAISITEDSSFPNIFLAHPWYKTKELVQTSVVSTTEDSPDQAVFPSHTSYTQQTRSIDPEMEEEGLGPVIGNHLESSMVGPPCDDNGNLRNSFLKQEADDRNADENQGWIVPDPQQVPNNPITESSLKIKTEPPDDESDPVNLLELFREESSDTVESVSNGDLPVHSIKKENLDDARNHDFHEGWIVPDPCPLPSNSARDCEVSGQVRMAQKTVNCLETVLGMSYSDESSSSSSGHPASSHAVGSSHDEGAQSSVPSDPCSSSSTINTTQANVWPSYQCDLCQLQFSSQKLWSQHRKSHSDGMQPKTKHNCTFCTYSADNAGDLKRHGKIHSEEKPYKCPQCSKAFVHKKNLRYHLMGHTGQNPYECDQCFKTFARKNHLDVHRRTHTQERNRTDVRNAPRSLCKKRV